MSEIVEIVSTIFVGLILLAGAVLMVMVAIAGLGLLWKEFKIPFKQTKKRGLPNFYSQIPTTHIGPYQSYVDRAFQLSETLEFEEDDPRLCKLLEQAVNNDSLTDLYLRVMIIQYVHADKYLREKYQRNWVKKVINRKDADFFPNPWAIISARIKHK